MSANVLECLRVDSSSIDADLLLQGCDFYQQCDYTKGLAFFIKICKILYGAGSSMDSVLSRMFRNQLTPTIFDGAEASPSSPGKLSDTQRTSIDENDTTYSSLQAKVIDVESEGENEDDDAIERSKRVQQWLEKHCEYFEWGIALVKLQKKVVEALWTQNASVVKEGFPFENKLYDMMKQQMEALELNCRKEKSKCTGEVLKTRDGCQKQLQTMWQIIVQALSIDAYCFHATLNSEVFSFYQDQISRPLCEHVLRSATETVYPKLLEELSTFPNMKQEAVKDAKEIIASVKDAGLTAPVNCKAADSGNPSSQGLMAKFIKGLEGFIAVMEQ